MLAINIPADGLFLAVERRIREELSAERCKAAVCEYIDRFLEAKPEPILSGYEYIPKEEIGRKINLFMRSRRPRPSFSRPCFPRA